MAVTQFDGRLNSNEIFASIYNMIISQDVLADNIKGTKSQLVDKARVDGSMYGDTKLYYSTDVLKSEEWGGDAETGNLLKTYRPKDPQCQAITIDKFRQISLTVDNYLSKRAWTDPTAFNSFNSVMKGWIRDTKRVYDSTLYNSFFGTAVANGDGQNLTWAISTESGSASEAQQIAENMANLIDDMTDVSRDFNDYGNLRSYSEEEIKVVWNCKFLNKIKKIDLPTIFHADGLMDKFTDSLPSRYFGTINASGGTVAASNTTIRSLVEKDYTVSKVITHVFPGDLLPDGATYLANETYTVNSNIICKVYVKLPPIMSGFEVGTSFFNAKALNENNYLTWGHNTLQHLYNYPFITVKKGS